jgi:putative flippase GtrA
MLYRFLKFDKTLVKFIIVGVINTLVGSALIFILYNIAGMGYWLSSGISYILISVQSFFLNKYFTFGVKEWTLFMIAAFAMNIAICYGIAYGIAKPLMNYFLQNSPQRIRENAALFTGICLFTGLNYIGQRFVVFRNNKGERYEP